MLTTNRRHTLYGEFHRRYPITLSPGDCSCLCSSRMAKNFRAYKQNKFWN